MRAIAVGTAAAVALVCADTSSQDAPVPPRLLSAKDAEITTGSGRNKRTQHLFSVLIAPGTENRIKDVHLRRRDGGRTKPALDIEGVDIYQPFPFFNNLSPGPNRAWRGAQSDGGYSAFTQSDANRPPPPLPFVVTFRFKPGKNAPLKFPGVLGLTSDGTQNWKPGDRDTVPGGQFTSYAATTTVRTAVVDPETQESTIVTTEETEQRELMVPLTASVSPEVPETVEAAAVATLLSDPSFTAQAVAQFALGNVLATVDVSSGVDSLESGDRLDGRPRDVTVRAVFLSPGGEPKSTRSSFFAVHGTLAEPVLELVEALADDPDFLAQGTLARLDAVSLQDIEDLRALFSARVFVDHFVEFGGGYADVRLSRADPGSIEVRVTMLLRTSEFRFVNTGGEATHIRIKEVRR